MENVKERLKKFIKFSEIFCIWIWSISVTNRYVNMVSLKKSIGIDKIERRL
jgi:hypothetical protein